MTNVVYPDGIVKYQYGYHGLTNVVAKDGRRMTMQYDADGRLTRYVDINGFVIGYAYDGEGNVTNLVYPGGKAVAYEYDPLNRLSALTDWLANRTTYGYDDAGNVTNCAYPNGTSIRYAYNKNGQLILVENVGVPGHPLPRFAYVLDELGNRVAETRRNTSVASPVPETVNYSYDPADRILTAGATTFAFDKNGNLTNKVTAAGTTRYTFDYNYMLTKVQTATNTWQYEYDPLLNRVSAQADTETSMFVVNPNPH